MAAKKSTGGLDLKHFQRLYHTTNCVPEACPVSKSAILGGYTTVTLNRPSTVQNTRKTSLSYWPDVLSPGLEVNLATSTILTANCCAVCRWIHRLTTLNGPLKQTNKQTWRRCSERNNAAMNHKQCTLCLVIRPHVQLGRKHCIF
jgi:hypothetical protein